MIHDDKEMELTAYADYLLKHALVPEKHAPHYVRWVRQFFNMPVAAGPGQTTEDRIEEFTHGLRRDQKPDWMVEQAERAVRMYFVNFRKNAAWTPSCRIEPKSDGTLDCAKFLFGSGDERGDRHNRPGFFSTGNGGRNAGWKDRPAEPGKWRHVVWVYSGGYNGRLTIYVDGKPETRQSYFALHTVGGHPMHLATGWNTANGTGRMLSGSLASLRVYDYARTEEEIAKAFAEK